MAYTDRGNSSNIIVGAAAVFIADTAIDYSDLPDFSTGSNATTSAKSLFADSDNFDSVGYTMNGLELQFQPDFGEVRVDQILDVAKLYKQGMQVNLNTTFAEATLENLLVALAYNRTDLDDEDPNFKTLDINAGRLGECPVERGIVAVGPGTGDCETSDTVERVYVAYKALSIENVTVSAKRDEASMFEVSFRLLPDSSGTYGKIIDRNYDAS